MLVNALDWKLLHLIYWNFVHKPLNSTYLYTLHHRLTHGFSSLGQMVVESEYFIERFALLAALSRLLASSPRGIVNDDFQLLQKWWIRQELTMATYIGGHPSTTNLGNVAMPEAACLKTSSDRSRRSTSKNVIIKHPQTRMRLLNFEKPANLLCIYSWSHTSTHTKKWKLSSIEIWAFNSSPSTIIKCLSERKGEERIREIVWSNAMKKRTR